MESERKNSYPEGEKFQIPVDNKNVPKNTEKKKESLGGNYKETVNSGQGTGKILKEKILFNDALLEKLGFDQTAINQIREQFKTGTAEEQKKLYEHIRREYVEQKIEEKIQKMRKKHPEAAAEILFLEDLISEEKTLEDLLPPNEDEVETEVTTQILGNSINKLLATLPDREREVLEMYYGLNGKRPMTLQEIGAQTPSVVPLEIYYQTIYHKSPDKITPERVRQIIVKTLRKLRHSEQIDLIREFW